jgi:hypothetical protein
LVHRKPRSRDQKERESCPMLGLRDLSGDLWVKGSDLALGLVWYLNPY